MWSLAKNIAIVVIYLNTIFCHFNFHQHQLGILWRQAQFSTGHGWHTTAFVGEVVENEGIKTSPERKLENTNILFLQLKACNNTPSIYFTVTQFSDPRAWDIRKAFITLRNHSYWLLTIQRMTRLFQVPQGQQKTQHLLTPVQNTLKAGKRAATERSIDTCYNMDGAWKHHADGENPDTKDHVLHYFFQIWNVQNRQIQSIKAEVHKWLTVRGFQEEG